MGPDAYAWFLDSMRYVRTFITNARYDSAVYAPSIPALLTRLGTPATVDVAARSGVARPGWIRLHVHDGGAAGAAPAADVEIRFPSYESSGHMVTLTQAAAFAADLEDWLAQP
jgi:hypothetical protein